MRKEQNATRPAYVAGRPTVAETDSAFSRRAYSKM